MRIAITGATGNVGVALVRALSADPRVTAVTGLARRLPELRLPKVDWIAGDILTSDLAAVMAGADAVVHLAWAIQPARDRALTRRINVDGSARVFAAAGAAGAGAVVHASSVGAYSPGPRAQRVGEDWPTGGIASSFYSVDKAAAERALDAFEAAHPAVRTVRLRPGIVFQRGAAEEIRRYFLGPFFPGRLLRPGLVPVVPDVRNVRFQAVHAADLAQAYRLALLTPQARGAYNIAAEPVLDLKRVAGLLHALPVPVWTGVARAAAALTWRARLQPTPPGWLDLGVRAPIMDGARARDELGWAPERTALESIGELLGGLADAAGEDTPPLAAGEDAPGRANEVATGLGARPGV